MLIKVRKDNEKSKISNHKDNVEILTLENLKPIE